MKRVFAWINPIAASSWVGVPIAAVVAIAISCFCYIQDGAGQGEPLFWFSGASAWPSIAIILFAGLLSLHFIGKTHLDLRENAKFLTEHFTLGDFNDFEQDTSLSCWQASASQKARLSTATAVDIATLWRDYIRLGSLSSRVGRCIPMGFLYIAGIWAIAPALGPPPIAPIRGGFPYITLIWVTVSAFVLLAFFVIDAILLHEGFLKQLATDDTTHWPKGTGKGFKYTRRTLTAHCDDLADYWDIVLIAKRTKVVGGKIYYPFIILSLLIIARLNYFDNWTWPPVLVIVFCSHFSLAFFAAWRLPKIAKDYRDKVLERLKRRRRQAFMQAQKTPEAVDTMVEEIEATHQGAFSYLWEQPVIRAALLPSSGLGLITLLQYLPH